MERKLKIILGLTTASLIIQVAFVLLVLKLLAPLSLVRNVGNEGDVSLMSREERLKLLEQLWQSPDFKTATEAVREQAFKSIVVK